MIYIRVDGANLEGIGMGHLHRMMDLSHHILKNKGLSPIFIISGYQETLDSLNRASFKYIEIDNENETNEILEIGQSAKKDILIIDMCDKDEEFVERLLEKYFVISFDDKLGGAKWSDIVINSVVDSSNERKNHFCGPKYFLIRPEIAKYNLKYKKINDNVNKLLVCLGGSDPCSVNLMMIDWLEGLDFSGKIDWVLGSSVSGKELIIERLKNLKLDITPKINYIDMGKLYHRSDLCISAAGFSLYEMACAGLPALTICLYSHQIPTAKKFEETGATHNLGYYKDINEVALKAKLIKFLNDKSQRNSMSRNGKAFVDGLGMERIVEKIDNYINLKMGETI
tara:strand:+ start:18240 stop:19259 length:1020 start_codon:yes stop_codon:yes gene_type:complete